MGHVWKTSSQLIDNNIAGSPPLKFQPNHSRGGGVLGPVQQGHCPLRPAGQGGLQAGPAWHGAHEDRVDQEELSSHVQPPFFPVY